MSLFCFEINSFRHRLFDGSRLVHEHSGDPFALDDNKDYFFLNLIYCQYNHMNMLFVQHMVHSVIFFVLEQ